MSTLLNASEVLGFAVYIEQNGYEFYTEGAKKFNNEKLVKLFHYMAEEEQNHERTFKTLKQEIGSFTPPESYPGEYEQYMKDYLKGFAPKSSDNMKKLVADTKNETEALDLALGFEKESVVFYSTLKNFVNEATKKTLDKIIEEEVNHILKINNFKNNELPEAQDVDAT